MNILNTQHTQQAPAGAVATLKRLGLRHSKKLIITLGLVIAENALYLLYPLLAGFAVNAILAGNALHAVLYAVLVFVMWRSDVTRCSVDTSLGRV